MCYVCNEPIVGYDHFSQGRSYSSGKCPLYDDTKKRHQEEIALAENAAKQQVLRENSKLYEEDVAVPEVRFVRTRM
jgi:TRIAD3 protein (E3 ubiquitin-protein ligase RNF216)